MYIDGVQFGYQLVYFPINKFISCCLQTLPSIGNSAWHIAGLPIDSSTMVSILGKQLQLIILVLMFRMQLLMLETVWNKNIYCNGN